MNAVNLFRGEEGSKVYEPGDTVFTSGETGEHMFVVLKGKIDIKIGDRVVETVEPGGIFGELAMVDKQRFTFLVQSHPFFALYVLKLLAERLRRYTS